MAEEIETGGFTINPKGEIVPATPHQPGTTGPNGDTGQNAGAGGSAGGATFVEPPGYAGIGSGPSGGDWQTTGPQAPIGGPGATGAGGDFSTMLGIYGLPPDIQAKVNQIFAQTADVTQATALALAYIRGTDWYAQTYPGIQEGLQSGLFNNEADYRAYVSAIDQLSQQYSGSNVTSDQIAAYIKSGYNPSYVGKLFQGQATVAANTPNWQELSGQFGTGQMSADQLTALGNESSGIDTGLGQVLQNHLQQAVTRMTKAFNGVVATPSVTLGAQGLQAPQLAGQKQPNASGNSDVGAT